MGTEMPAVASPQDDAEANSDSGEVAVFGRAPLLYDEDPKEYDELWRRIIAAVLPSDILEGIWIRDVLDLQWEVLRLRRLKAALLRAQLHEVTHQVMDVALLLERKLATVEGIDRLMASAEARRNNALREIDRHRATLGAALRKAVEEAEDAEFTEVGAPEQPVSTVQ